ncbi:hypothetical protein [Sabulicella glaciei]|uniref:DUF2384 domain-containing protein n=1 Tax=Sabulicella glaciei TaxID=2984948 RepID=A0ABT3NZL4_9PROT|nr:hypothetical protein [Roseococcus sp. MDT2-1-1]MCW8087600.1 hypothetical protein [Roseococcus sp. MDT2-1-1]
MSDDDDDAKAEARRRAAVSARWDEYRREWLKEHPSLPASEFVRHAGVASPDAAGVVQGWEEVGRVSAILQGGQRLYPLFQLGPNGQPRPERRPLLLAMRGRLESWRLAAWLTGNNAEFNDWATPLEVIGRDPGAVVAAAKRAMAEVSF